MRSLTPPPPRDPVADLGAFLQSFDPTLGSLPPAFRLVDVWTSRCVDIPVVIDFYPEEWRPLRVNPVQGSAAISRFDPVLHRDRDEAQVSVLKGMPSCNESPSTLSHVWRSPGFSVSELHLIFRPHHLTLRNPDQPIPFPNFYAYVFRFSDINNKRSEDTSVQGIRALQISIRRAAARAGH